MPILIPLFVLLIILVGSCSPRYHPYEDSFREINAQVNNSFLYVSDKDNFGIEDYWQTPLEFRENASGDCEDFVAYKAYLLIRKLGYSERRLSFMYLEHVLKEPHLVLIVDNRWILDNNNNFVLSKNEYLKETGYINKLIFDYDAFLNYQRGHGVYMKYSL